jgi:xylulokinase
MRIVSDIAGIEQVVPARQIGASYGDAFLAGIGVGLFGGVSEAHRWVRMGTSVQPDPMNKAVYDAAYRLYRELYERTADSMRKSAGIAQMGKVARG